MARLPLVDIEKVTDPEILGIFAWVTEMEGKVPNHFAVELNFPELMKSKLGFTKILWETGEFSMEEIQHTWAWLYLERMYANTALVLSAR